MPESRATDRPSNGRHRSCRRPGSPERVDCSVQTWPTDPDSPSRWVKLELRGAGRGRCVDEARLRRTVRLAEWSPQEPGGDRGAVWCGWRRVGPAMNETHGIIEGAWARVRLHPDCPGDGRRPHHPAEDDCRVEVTTVDPDHKGDHHVFGLYKGGRSTYVGPGPTGGLGIGCYFRVISGRKCTAHSAATSPTRLS
jgi:hypothetical protein